MLTELMKVREPLYLEVADHVVDTDASNIRDVANTIAELVIQPLHSSGA